MPASRGARKKLQNTLQVAAGRCSVSPKVPGAGTSSSMLGFHLLRSSPSLQGPRFFFASLFFHKERVRFRELRLFEEPLPHEDLEGALAVCLSSGLLRGAPPS